MASDDLFIWLDSIFTKGKPQGTFPLYIAHRFLASHADWANVARDIARDGSDAAMAFALWQSLTPRSTGAPRLTYAAPKKRADAEQLTQRMMTVLHVRRAVAEEMQALIATAGRLDDLYQEYGVPQQDGAEGSEAFKQPRKGVKAKPTGLLSMLG